MSRYKYIAVEGCIGAGKTELAKIIAAKIDAVLILEDYADNAYLERFYKNKEQYAFPLEVSFLVERFQQLKLAQSKKDLFKNALVSDYLLEKSLVFGNITLEDDQKHLLQSMYKLFEAQLSIPDLVIYLQQPVKALMKNIHKRGRTYEITGINESYLTRLNETYLSFLKNSPNLRVVNLDMTNADFIENKDDLNVILNLSEMEFPKGFNRLKVREEGE